MIALRYRPKDSSNAIVKTQVAELNALSQRLNRDAKMWVRCLITTRSASRFRAAAEFVYTYGESLRGLQKSRFDCCDPEHEQRVQESLVGLELPIVDLSVRWSVFQFLGLCLSHRVYHVFSNNTPE